MPEAPFLTQWTSVVRRIRLGRTVKAVAVMLTVYADPDGSRVYPGVARLSYECELSYTVVKGALRTLRSLGLIVKVGRRGDADEYRLILHEDLLERVNVPTPSQVNAEVEKIRAAWKGTYQPGLRSTRMPADGALRSTRTPADDGDGEGLRSSAPTAETTELDWPAVNGVPPETEPAVNGSTSLRSTPLPATLHDPPRTTTLHSDKDLSADAAATRAPETESEDRISPPADLSTHPRCPHGRSTRLNRQGEPRCEDCRAEQAVAVQQIEQAAHTVQVGPAKCPEHGLQAGRRADGKPNCTMCRVMEAKTP